jgi:hypothetical protein
VFLAGLAGKNALRKPAFHFLPIPGGPFKVSTHVG